MRFLVLVLAVLLPQLSAAQSVTDDIEFWYEDTNMRRGGGYPPDFYEMFTEPEKWDDLRDLIDVYYLRAPTLRNVIEAYGEEFITDYFAPVLRQENIPVAIDNVSDELSEDVELLRENGLTITHIALQSVLSKARRAIRRGG